MRDGDTIEIPLGVGAGPNRFDAALWWPEGVLQLGFATIEFHNDIDLAILDPSGGVRDSSVSIPSVFERARVAGAIASGTWKVRIRGFDVPRRPRRSTGRPPPIGSEPGPGSCEHGRGR